LFPTFTNPKQIYKTLESVCLVNTKHLDNTFVLYSLKNKDSLIEPLLHFL